MDKKVLVVYVESWADVNGLYSLRPLGVYSSTEKAREAIDNLGDAEYSYGAKFNHGGGGYYDEDLADMDEFFDIEDDGLIEYAVNIVNLDSLTDFSVQHILDIEDEEMPEEVNEDLEEQTKDKEQEIYIITQHDSPNGGDWDQKILGTYLSAEMAKKAVENLLEMQSTSSEYSKDNSHIDPYFFGYKINKVVLNAPAISSEESLECVFNNVKKGDQKYELTDETKKIEINGKTRTVYRIRALKDFTCQGREVHAGDLGGFVSSEEVLSQGGTAWIFDDACVSGAEITGEVSIADNAKICALGEYSSIKIKDNARIYGNAKIFDKTEIYNDARVGGEAVISDSKIYDNANIRGEAYVSNSKVYKDAEVNGIIKLYNKIYPEENKVNDIVSEAKNLAESKTLVQPTAPKVNKEKNKGSQSLDD